MAMFPKFTAWGDPGKKHMHGFPVAIAMHCPRPRGAGEEAEGRAGWGLSEET